MLILLDVECEEDVGFWLDQAVSGQIGVFTFQADEELCSMRARGGFSFDSWAGYLAHCRQSRNEPKILVVCLRLDRRIAALCKTLASVNEGHELAISLLVVEPPSSVEEIIGDLNKVMTQYHLKLRQCWVTGVRDSRGQSVNRDRVTTAISQYLYFLAKDPVAEIKSELFRSMGSDPIQSVVMWGWISWLPKPDEIQKNRFDAMAEAVRLEIHALGDRAQKLRELKDLAVSALAAVRATAIPHDLASGQGKNYQDFLPAGPGQPFGKALHQLSREGLQDHIKSLIDTHRADGIQYKGELRRALEQIAERCRKHGQKVLAGQLGTYRDRLAALATLGGVPILLKGFFRHLSPNTEERMSPCVPADTPSDADSVKWVIDPLGEVLKASIEKMPRRKDWWIAALASAFIASAGIGIPGLKIDVRITLVAISLLPPLWLFWRARRASSAMYRDLIDVYVEVMGNYRQEYAGKVEWVVNKSSRTFEQQFCAELQASGRNLKINYERLVPGWRLMDAENVMDGTVVSMDASKAQALQAFVDSIRHAGALTLNEAMYLKSIQPLHGETIGKALLACDRIMLQQWALSSVSAVELSRYTGLQVPSFMAWSANDFSSLHRKKMFLLPSSRRDLAGSLNASSANGQEICYGDFVAPAVLYRRSNVNQLELKDALNHTGGST